MPAPKLTRKIAAAPSRMVSIGRPASRGSVSAGKPAGMSPTTAMPWPSKSNSADSSTDTTTTTTGPGTGKRVIRTTCSSTNMAAASRSVGRWIDPAFCASSTRGATRPSASILTPVIRPICPIRIESDTPAKKPVRIGRDRKVARTPSRSSRASR